MIFTPLHINSEYSFGKSSIRIDKLIEKAKKIGLKKLLITDKNNLFAVSEFVYKVKKNNIEPIIGLELNVENFQLILIAKNYEGYIHLNELSSKKMHGEKINRKDINHTNIFIIDHPKNGCFYLNDTILNFENFWIGSNNPINSNEIYVQEGFFLDEEDRETIDILNKMNNSKIDITSIEPLKFQIENNNWFRTINSLINECSFDFPKNLNILPKFPNDKNFTSNQYLKKILNENFNKLFKDVKNKNQYLERIKYEIKIIEKLKFEDYFLIIWDLIKWAKSRKILIGPGRGSSSGSLVSYVLNITEIDPIKYNLYFERFLNPDRVTMPDIDIDIQDTRRNEVIDYIFEKYGYQNVGLISTFSRLGAKSSIRDVARYFDVPIRDVNVLSKLIPNDLSLKEAYKQKANFRALINSSTNYENIFRIAQKIEGLPRQFSTHAAGLVISDENLNNKTATIKANNDYNQIQLSMNNLANFKLLKIDLLGLRNLTIIQRIQEEIYKNIGKRVLLSKIPLNDSKTLKLLSLGKTNGIFQLESYGMKKTLLEVGVDSFNDIVAIISLFRPGPMDNILLYANRKNSNQKIESVSTDYDAITKNTYGIIVYQEQIMEIVQKISGMSFAQADIFRRAIGKKQQSLIVSLKEKFINGSIKKGYKMEEAEKIYNLIEKFANYGFNKSHAVSYGMLSYWMGFLKSRFKFEFYTALLEFSIASQMTLKKYIDEAKIEDIEIISPLINLSEERVINKDKKIILPLQIIKGFGTIATQKLLKERKKGKFVDFFNFISRLKFVGFGESTLELLIKSNSAIEFGNMQSLLDSLPSALRYTNMITIKKDEKIILDKSIISKPKLVISDRNISNEIFNEKKLFGYQLNAFITSEKENENKLLYLKPGDKKEVVFLVEKVRKITTKTNKAMAKITISDSTTTLFLIAFPDVFKFIEWTNERTIVKGLINYYIKNNEKIYVLEKQWKEL